MSDFRAFLALAYENLADSNDLDDLDGLDEVMYQTGIMLALTRADAETSRYTPGGDGGGASAPGTIAIARSSPCAGACGEVEGKEPSAGVPPPHATGRSEPSLARNTDERDRI